jgi:hypothetical protein
VILEQLGKDSLGDLPVLDHVGDAGWHAQVVLEHVDDAVTVANEITAADVGPDSVRGRDTAAGLQEIAGFQDQPGRNNSLLENLLVIVDIVDEEIECREALLESILDAPPFR